MSNDIKTLADTQPGGRVRLGDRMTIEKRARELLAVELHKDFGPASAQYVLDGNDDGCTAMRAIIAALSAQPSPGGQGDALTELTAKWRRESKERFGKNEFSVVAESLDVCAHELEAALAARQPVRIYGCCAQPEGELHTAECPNMRHLAARQPVGQEPVCNGGFVISNGSGEKYMAWGQVGPEWTADRSAALWLVRRADAEALAAENEDAWSILPVERCALPPNGWACTLASGHEGPCPTIAAPPAQAVDLGQTFQAGVAEWMGQCFLPSLYCNMTERGDRLLEEVLELLQAHGYDKARVPTLVDYVFSRPVGDPAQEVGGVMVTLAGYCWVAGLDMHVHGHAELARISHPEVMARIRAKQEAKNALHFDTPLPGNAAAPAPAQAVPLGRWSQWHADDLHVAVHTALSVHAGSLSQKKRAAISAYVKRLLIDSQAVGNG